MEIQCGEKKTTDGDEHKQSTIRRSEYNVITIPTSDSIKESNYNISYNLSQNSLNVSHKSRIEYSISISYWPGIQGWVLDPR